MLIGTMTTSYEHLPTFARLYSCMPIYHFTLETAVTLTTVHTPIIKHCMDSCGPVKQIENELLLFVVR